MDAGPFIFAVAVLGALSFFWQVAELLVGVRNGRWIKNVEKETKAGVKRADERGDLLQQQLAEIAKGLNGVIEHLNAQAAAAPAGEMRGGVDPRQLVVARMEREDQRAVAKADIKGAIGPVAAELWQRFFPDEWTDALKRPHLWQEIFTRLKPRIEERARALPGLPENHEGTTTKPAPYMT